MERQEILSMLQNIISEAVDNEDVVLEDNTIASDVEGWDSLVQVLIIGELQNRLGVKFTSAEIGSFANVGEFVSAIEAKI